jgi:Flp pilus assembly protein TadB
MNNLVSRILGWLAALGAMAAMFYKGKAATEKAKRAAENAERERVSAATYQRINTQRAELEQQHQQEQLNDETSIDGRDHFNNDFK